METVRGQAIVSQQLDDEDRLVLEVRQDNTIHVVIYPILPPNSKNFDDPIHPWVFLDDPKSLNYLATGLEKCSRKLKVIAEKLVKEKLNKKRLMFREEREKKVLKSCKVK
jgi:hypothetical protein